MKQEKKYNLYLLPLLAILVISPLIVRMYKFDPKLESYSWYSNTNEKGDFFLYYKVIFIICMAIVMLGIMSWIMYQERNRRKKQFLYTDEHWLIGLGCYLFFACFSTLVSKYRYFGVHGIADQFESVWVIIGYCVILVYAYYMIREEADLYVLEYATLILAVITGVLGTFQFAGMDFWASKLGRILMVPSKYAAQRKTLEFNFAGSGNPVYLSLYNINYVGVFCILLIPVLLAVLISAKKKIIRGITAVAIFLMLVCMVGCGSKTGILVGAMLVVIAMLLFAKGKKKLFSLAVLAILGIVLAGGYYVTSGTNIFEKLADSLKPVKNNYAVTDFSLEDEDVSLTYQGHKIYFQTAASSDTGIQFRAWSDENDNLVYYQDEDGSVHFEDKDFQDITLNIYAQVNDLDFIFVINANGSLYRFTAIDGKYEYVNSLGRVDELAKANAVLFKNYDALMSGRGYIWARTIPLLKKTIFVGTGADSFTLVFPQNDYVAKQNAGYENQIITKPHNLYLQIAVQFGVLALLGYLFLYGFYFWQTMRVLKKAAGIPEAILAKGIMISLLGYCIMGITNDSSVTVAALSFLFLGIGFAINRMLKVKIGLEMKTTEE